MCMVLVRFPRAAGRSLIVAMLVVGAAWLALAGCSKKQPPRTLTIVFSNDVEGEIRSCTCPTGAFGGLARRATFVAAIRDSTPDVLLLDGGDFFGTTVDHGMDKAELAMKSMVLMGYHGVVIGENELELGTEYIVAQSREIGLPVLVANLYDAVTDSLLFPPNRIVTLASGLRIGIIGVMSPNLRLPPQVPTGSLRITDAVDAVKREVQSLRGEVDSYIVLGHLPLQEAQRIAQTVPEVDVVVFGHEGRGMPRTVRTGYAFLLQVRPQGRYMGLAFATMDDSGRVQTLSTQVRPLSPDYADDEAVVGLFREYNLKVDPD
jgi:5'-nucleotidase/UDP-sugar diphosphatase